jgi:hypothetical protein
MRISGPEGSGSEFASLQRNVKNTLIMTKVLVEVMAESVKKGKLEITNLSNWNNKT